MRTFEEIADAQGWDEHTQLLLLREYVYNQQDEDALSTYAEERASVEQETDDPQGVL